MIGKGYVVEDDLMGIARRIRAIDPSYFVFYSYEKRRYEVYCSDDLAVAAVVLPFDRLDERSVRKVLETRRVKNCWKASIAKTGCCKNAMSAPP